jgi:hypothetical protein
VYKAFDESEGVERAWNEVAVSGEFSALEDKERERIFAEIRLLKQVGGRGAREGAVQRVANRGWVDVLDGEKWVGRALQSG